MAKRMDWYQLKLFLEHSSKIDMGTFHVLLGMPVQLLAAALLRTSVTKWLPWLLVLGLELINEWSDLHLDLWPSPGMQYGEGVQDIWLTMLLPTLLLVIARHRPALLVGSNRAG